MAARRAELLVGAAGAALGAANAAIWAHGAGQIAAWAILGAALGAGRRYARVAWLVAAAALLAMAQGTALGTALVATLFVLVPAHAFCAARWNGPWAALGALVALVGASELSLASAMDSAVPALMIPAAAWAAGRVLREREQVAAQLAERARELEEEREAHARLSVRYERARIASELHDIVAHAISVMVVQASAGQRLAAVDPQLTAETFEAIAGAAHQAEQDMGRLVALLGDDSATGAAPDLALIEELVRRAAGSGLQVTLRLEGEREELAAPLAQAAYRIVQEGITNALRYASGGAVSVLVGSDPQALVVAVENAPTTGDAALAGTGTGNGLRGLRERVGACGGTLEAGQRADGGWRLVARLPRRVTARR